MPVLNIMTTVITAQGPRLKGTYNLRNKWPGEVGRHTTSVHGQKANDFGSLVSGLVQVLHSAFAAGQQP